MFEQDAFKAFCAVKITGVFGFADGSNIVSCTCISKLFFVLRRILTVCYGLKNLFNFFLILLLYYIIIRKRFLKTT